jgi:serine protease Do
MQGVGSGFIVTADGYIVTSNHLVENAAEIQVILDDGKRLAAEVRGRDPKTDLALLKVDVGKDLPFVVFGDSDTAHVGDWVVAIGNPFGLGGTATTGIISARGRDINAGPYDDYLQIDAPINRGNSGGPLFDLSGRVLGVNTAIYSPNGANVGIGFAVPASQAKAVIAQLMQNGQVQRGWLGVQIQKLDQALAESLDLPDDKGALITDVSTGSPAAQAGLRVGDVILALNTHKIDAMRDLPRLVADISPGEKANLTVWRQGKQLELEVAIAAYPDKTLAAVELAPPVAEGGKLGLTLAPISDELRQRLAVVEGVEGALVIEVEAGSPAAQQGLRPGDVIVQADSKPVSVPQDVVNVVQATHASERNRILLLINRQGDQRFVTVQLG